MADPILYFDLETDRKTGKIIDIGAHYKGKELHENALEKLKRWIDEAKYICGHNIVHHDIPILNKLFGSNIFHGKIILDTLLWSPILFAKNPYHKLVKGYKIVNDTDVNNPLSDAKLTKELLLDEVNAFREFDTGYQEILFGLLSDNPNYKGFFKAVKPAVNGIDPEPAIKAFFKDQLCRNLSLKEYIEQNSEALAYALAVLNTSDGISVCPAWVNETFPKAQEILEEIRFKTCDDPACDYCRESLNPQKALLKYFGFDSFKTFDNESEIGLQEQTVRAGIQNTSFVAVFPTGGGKSLTFQLPALMKGELARQLTVVISPLVSLMKDQVDVLENRHSIVKAVAVNRLLSPLERKEALEKVEDGRAHILYIAPESLRSKTIFRLLNNRKIARFVIDEAHCFSSWGHDFRVDYLYIASFVKEIEKNKLYPSHIPVSCFTATAKPQVVEDIKAYFKKRLDIRLEEYITRTSRKNLMYEVIHVDDSSEKPAYLINLLHRVESPAIIYVSRVKRVEKLAVLLQKNDFSVTGFHGKMDKDEKLKNQNAFMKEEADYIIATSAFGMGIDKDNVKSVIHYDISDSLENYVQEAGRAGRKKEIRAACYVLFNEDDLNKHFSLLQQTKINQKEIDQIWRAIKGMTKFREKISNSALEIARRAGWNTEIRELENKVTASLAALEDRKFLKRSLNSPRIFADSLLVRNLDRAVQIVNKSQFLTDIQKQNCARVLQRIVKDEEIRVDYLADILNLKLKDVQDTITTLRHIKLLGDNRDLTAFLDLRKSKTGSEAILKKFTAIEKKLPEILKGKHLKMSLRHINQKLIDGAIEGTTTHDVSIILNWWDGRNYISKSRVDRKDELYEIHFKKEKDEIIREIESRHETAVNCFRNLEEKYALQKQQYNRKEDIPVLFSLIELKNETERFSTSGKLKLKSVENALLFLNHIKCIKLEGGFMVIYNRLNIERTLKDNKKRFTLEDYKKLKEHYDHKIQQIHIVGEYAKRCIKNYQDALTFTDDYFKKPYDEFLKKYFPARKTKITRAMTETKFDELFGQLDLAQKKIVDDNKSKNILVAAGPGSGKTRILVHKIASLLLLEDIKPEQFLMLTFSKAAALEFKSRVFKIVPEFGRLIKIATFHGYAFELLGQTGDLIKSEHIIQDCIDAIQNEDIDISSITNKSVLVLDEFQDVDNTEWEFIKLIKEKAENIRIIAVGDDDQSIYEFRGSSTEHMLNFKDHFKAQTYSLLTNYRSRSNIVGFNNEFLKKIQKRIKKDQILQSKHKQNGNIRITQYKSNVFYNEIAEDISVKEKFGTTAVLTRTNIEAFLIAALLKKKGLNVKLVAGNRGFKLSQLYEMRMMSDLLESELGETGFISKDIWEKAKTDFNKLIQDNPLNSLFHELFEFFEDSHGRSFEYIDWRDYIGQIQIEDVISPESDTVYVSTMHKSKGKEYDSVFLYLSDYKMTNDQQKRLVYVAMSRTKENLYVHYNSDYLNHINAEDIKYKFIDTETQEPDEYEYLLDHKDINLNSVKYTQRECGNIKTGDQLKFDFKIFEDNKAPGLFSVNDKNILLFSKNFIENKLHRFKKKGYEINSAFTEYIVYWYCQEDDKEYKVVLPRVRFKKV